MLFSASGGRVGGATMALLHLALGFSGLGVEPVLLTTPPLAGYRRLYRRLAGCGVVLVVSRWRWRGLVYWLWLAFAAVLAVKRLRVDMIHCHGTKEAAVLGLVGRLLGRRVVYTVEGDPLMEVYYADKRPGLLVRVLLAGAWFVGLRLASVVVGCSRWMAETLRRRYGVKALWVWNPIDYGRFSSADDRGLHGENIAVVARFERVKGIKTLIRAFSRVYRARPGSRLVLVGDGVERDELEAYARELGLGGSIVFMGFRDDVERVLADSCCLVMPSLYEPFGMAAAEAQAAGRPVIASATGGLVEIVKDGETGFLFRPADWLQLSEKLQKILDDPALRERMGAAARLNARRFAPEEIARRYLSIYRMLLTK